MTKFEKKTPVVEAIQWDGSVDGATMISEFMTHVAEIPVDLTVHISITAVTSGTVIGNSRLEFSRVFEAHMRAGEWLVHEQNGSNRIVADADFYRDYKEMR